MKRKAKERILRTTCYFKH